MKKYLFACLVFVGASSAIAQTFGTVNASQVSGTSGNSASISYLLGDVNSQKEKRKEKESDIQGSAYTTDVFLPGKLYYKDDFESDVFYRYNAYMEEIEIKSSNTPNSPVSGLRRDKNINLRSVDGKIFSFKTFIDNSGLTQNGYLTLLSDGKYKFYKRVDVKYTEGQKAQNSFVKAIPPRFSQFTEYYLEVPENNRIDELVISNRKLLKLLPADQRDTIKTYLKENKIKLKDEADVIQVLNWLEQQ
ncbi:MAG: hypothetical protein VX798_13840 [Bacteroidota bacterium]|uniref:Uncharacterized protein n=1 Tax=Flagellimonas profundi TaxID=2915620 RepID=A0ABS3FJK5_9FLAO|nr:hypothetical protein [Allomuricauda profundi]MBO0343398.1 hypothetical protein [Allomuricauda profundi]MEC7772266.1 hypothetical protein [Bacteroidota bacterium]